MADVLHQKSKAPATARHRSLTATRSGGASSLLRLLAVAICVGLPACFYTYGEIEHADWSAELARIHEARAPLNLSISFERRSEMIGEPGYEAVASVMAEGPFSIHGGREVASDLIAEIDALKRERMTALAPLALLTAFVIPGGMNYEVDLSVDVLDAQQKLVKRYHRTSEFSSWIGWIFVPWGYFASDLEAERNALVDMARSIVAEIYREDYDMFRGLEAERGSSS